MPLSQVRIIESQVALGSADIDLFTNQGIRFAISTITSHGNQARAASSCGDGQGWPRRDSRGQRRRCIRAHGRRVAQASSTGEAEIGVHGIAVAATRAYQRRAHARHAANGRAASLTKRSTVSDYATALKTGQHLGSVLGAVVAILPSLRGEQESERWG